MTRTTVFCFQAKLSSCLPNLINTKIKGDWLGWGHRGTWEHDVHDEKLNTEFLGHTKAMCNISDKSVHNVWYKVDNKHTNFNGNLNSNCIRFWLKAWPQWGKMEAHLLRIYVVCIRYELDIDLWTRPCIHIRCTNPFSTVLRQCAPVRHYQCSQSCLDGFQVV